MPHDDKLFEHATERIDMGAHLGGCTLTQRECQALTERMEWATRRYDGVWKALDAAMQYVGPKDRAWIESLAGDRE